MASNQRDLIVLVDYEDDIVIIDPGKNTREKMYIREHFNGQITEAKELCDVLEDVLPLERIKAILFIIISTNFRKFDDATNFRLACREFCRKNDIFFVSVPFTCLEATYATSETQTMVNEGEQVLITFSMVPGFPHGFTLLRENGRYRFLKYNRSQKFMFTDEWKKEYFDIFNPAKFILIHQILYDDRQEEIEMYNDFFEEYNAVTITQGPDFNLLSNAAFQKVLHLMGEKINPYDVAPPCLNEFFVQIGKDTVIEALLFHDPLPFEKSIVVDVDSSKKLMFYVRTEVEKVNGPKELLREIKLSSFKSKKIKISLKVDVNALYEFNVDPFDGEKLNKIFSDLKVDDSVAMMVFEKQTFEVFVRENDTVRVIENTGENIPIYISFTEEKPIVGEVAKNLYNTNPESVIFDLIKICSTTNSDIMSPKWGFRIFKENESMMISAQTRDGEKKSSVEFLLALILRHGLKLIKDKTGNKMDKMKIKFWNFLPNDILKQNFINAGKLMDVKR